MALPRHRQVPPGVSGFYHCISRCVRRAFLCGIDPVSQKNFNHRRQWVVDRMTALTNSFAVDIYAYAVMSNHVHTVLYLDPKRVDSWSDAEVIRRWKLVYHWRYPDKPLRIPKSVPEQTLKEWRRRLGDISWFMQALNEPIARRANAEDDCTGRFWEGRFQSLPLLDDASFTGGMVYADLNPIKAGMAGSLEDSDFTSIQQRIRELEYSVERGKDTEIEINTAKVSSKVRRRLPLLPIASSETPKVVRTSLSVDDYIELVHSSMDRALTQSNPWRDQLLDSLGFKPSAWQPIVQDFLTLFRSAAGSESAFADYMNLTGRVRQQDRGIRKVLYQ